MKSVVMDVSKTYLVVANSDTNRKFDSYAY
jgi:hypothetical protein